MSTSPPAPDPEEAAAAAHGWTFLSNHAHVLICLARDSELLLREIAPRVGITERAVQKILDDLEAEGLVERRRVGRRNRYELTLDRPLRHPLEAHRSVRELIELVTSRPPAAAKSVRPRRTRRSRRR